MPSSFCAVAASKSASPSSNSRRRDRLVPLVDQRLEALVPLRERQLDERLPVDLEHVEDVEHERARALLHRREAGSALVVERADLAVEHAVGRLDRLHDGPGDGLEARCQRLAVAARQLGDTSRDRHDRAVAVPLHLMEPALAGRHRVGGRGEHRPVRPLPSRRLVGLLLHEQPVLRIAAELRRNERPRPVQLLAVEVHGHPAVRLLLDELIRALVPDLDRTGAVVPAGISPSNVAYVSG